MSAVEVLAAGLVAVLYVVFCVYWWHVGRPWIGAWQGRREHVRRP